METNIRTTRRDALTAGLGAVAAAALAGCATQQPGAPTTQPTTRPTTQPGNDPAFTFAATLWENLKLAAAVTTAIPGLIPPQDVAAISAAEALGDAALAAWQPQAGQPIGVILQAEFFGLLPGVVSLIAQLKAKHAATVAVKK